MSNSNKSNIIVIGNGMVGYKFLEKLVAKGLQEQYNVIAFGEEPYVAYDRVHLSEYFADSNFEALQMAPRSWYDENNITLYSSDPVIDVDTKSQTIKSHKGLELTYEKLIFATGSAAFVPPINGVEKDGVFVYRTIEDLDAIISYAKTAKTGAVIGGGLLGLEAAKALLDLKVKAHVIEFAPRLMPRQIDAVGSDFLASKIESLGVGIHLNKNTKLIAGEGKVTAMQFTDDTEIPVDMVVISAGIKPRDEVAKTAGLEIGVRGGIIVNDNLETSAKNVYAIGECALYQGMIYGLVAPGYEMADVVVDNILKGEKTFSPFDMSTKLKLIGVDVASFGDPFCDNTEHDAIVYQNRKKGVYKRINISKDGKYLLGGILVGEAEEYNLLLQMTLNNMKVPEDAESLIIHTSGDGPAGGGVDALPDAAMICSCENVSKGAICDAVKAGNTDMFSVKTCTKAGTGCGGCVPMVKDIIDYTLSEMGVTVKKVICEHFEYSRQELYHLIQIKGITTYKEALAEYGTGCGCETCKPAVGNILASMTNYKVLSEATVLDTNDRYLANIQRGGTYSVVPRIPGGEITPEKLIVIGQVAQKWGLYTKITGGQRIDMFGAKLNDLPEIWEELVNEGFETGQAYGKSVRTVKSCVGSTWCRYGVQDSMTLAVDLENRYKGLRSPHKLKFAVSGCTRECAEAQCKDIGLIATDKGWALYVCGNGGTKPQHAELFATDLDTATCFKYIDRILSFYIRTADPLTRTATWLNKLEGGINYLREVVINDSLGICDELEAHMQHHADSYHCEWKDVVEDPAKRAKFKNFVNDDACESNLEWVDERGQKVPTAWVK